MITTLYSAWRIWMIIANIQWISQRWWLCVKTGVGSWRRLRSSKVRQEEENQNSISHRDQTRKIQEKPSRCESTGTGTYHNVSTVTEDVWHSLHYLIRRIFYFNNNSTRQIRQSPWSFNTKKEDPILSLDSVVCLHRKLAQIWHH